MERKLKNEELLEILNQRYAVKQFEKRDIDTTELEKVVTSILQLTPTSFWLQAYKFFIVKDKKIRSELREYSWWQTSVTDSDLYIVFCVPTNFDKSFIEKHVNNIQKIRWIDDVKKNWVIDFMNNKIIDAGDDLWIKLHEDWLTRQAYIALWNLMTSLAVIWIDSCPIEWLNPKEYNRILWLNEKNLTAKVTIAIWKRSPEDKYQNEKKVRFDKSELFEII